MLMALVIAAGCSKQEQEQKAYKVGIASGFESFNGIADGFKKGMADLGYVEGRNIVYDLQQVDPTREADKQIVQSFVDDGVDLIFTYTTEAAIWTKGIVGASGVPIVFAMAGIEDNDLVDSVHHPGGNITGVRYPGPDIIVKRFELLRELAPHIRRVWVAYDIHYPTNKPSIEQLREAAAASDVTLLEALVTTPAEIQADLETRVSSGNATIDAILIMPDAVTQSSEGWAFISSFATAHKIPVAGTGGGIYDANLVLSFNPDIFSIGSDAAPLADKILNGAPAGGIMVATPRSYLRINYKLAQELGLVISEGLMSRADEIIR